MSLQDISQVSISLNTSGMTRAGFGTPIFFTAHNFFKERVMSITSVPTAGKLLTTKSNGYKAVVSALSNTPSVPALKIARILASSIITPIGTSDEGEIEVGAVYTISITDKNDNVATASYEAQESDALEDVVTGILAQLNGHMPALDGITLLSNGSSFTIKRAANLPDATDVNDFVISNLSNVDVEADTDQEDILVALSNVQDVDDDWYAVAWENHTNKDKILDFAATLTAQTKLYFYGSSALASINTPFKDGKTPDSETDILGYLSNTKSLRVVGWWHHEADESFNELAYAGYNLPFDAGSITWANNQLQVSAAQNAQGYPLTQTQQQNLSNRHANWTAIKGGIVYSREGKVIGNEWIDNIRGRDNLKSDLEADLFNLLVSQQGGKIPYTDGGINVVVGIIKSRLEFYKESRGFLAEPIDINVPSADQIPRDDKVNRVLRGITFNATLAGAIQLVDLQGALEL